ncbi:MAG: alpha-galactosidase, partial [Myxococcota bacterium]
MLERRVHLYCEDSSLVLDFPWGKPRLLYWGARLTDESLEEEVWRVLCVREEPPASMEEEAELLLHPEASSGFSGTPGLEVVTAEGAWGVNVGLVGVERVSGGVDCVCLDSALGLRLVHEIRLCVESGVCSFRTSLWNEGDGLVWVQRCAAATLPVPSWLCMRRAFEGWWAKEFQRQDMEVVQGSYLRENRRGRTSHDSFPGLLLGGEPFSPFRGEVYGFHLGWSGNHRVRHDWMVDGRAYVQMEELLLPGEVRLRSGESYTTPWMFGTYTQQGLNGIRWNFQRFVRKHLLSHRRVRPVHYNTWEAVYFMHDEQKLCALATQAAALGVERFVLDDGWFRGRDSDRSGLGDWTVDTDCYPQGLLPLIQHVQSLGMEFGLWIEPEMVNPQSTLFEAHPEWVTRLPRVHQRLARNQLVLDLCRSEVQAFLFEAIDRLLCTYPIGYLKWDMNRDINQPGSMEGRPSVHAHVRALYALLERIKRTHPEVEIESCASGGGRADFGILQ